MGQVLHHRHSLQEALEEHVFGRPARVRSLTRIVLMLKLKTRARALSAHDRSAQIRCAILTTKLVAKSRSAFFFFTQRLHNTPHPNYDDHKSQMEFRTNISSVKRHEGPQTIRARQTLSHDVHRRQVSHEKQPQCDNGSVMGTHERVLRH